MSMAVKASRMGGRGYPGAAARPMGDPGLFGLIGAGVGIVKTGLKVGKKIFGNKPSQPMVPALPPPGHGQPPRGFQLPMPGAGRGGTMTRPPMNGGQAPPRGGTKPVYMTAMGGPPGPGYRPNKSGYWVTSAQGTPSWVSPGERWVKNRRRNPANARANDRAIGRIEGAKRYVKRLGRVTIRKDC